MNVGIDELERILRRYVSTGAAVVVVILGSGQAQDPAAGQSATAGQPTTVTVSPAPTTPGADSGTRTSPTSTTPAPPDRTAEPRRTTRPDPTVTRESGAPGRSSADPDSTGAPEPGSDVLPLPPKGSDTGSRRDRASGSVDTDSTTPNATTERSAAPQDTGAPRSTATGGGSSGTATEGTTAAATRGWGAPARVEEFDAGTEQWSIYDGAGHDGKGRRSPSAVTVQDGVLTITGDSSGTTAGMSWGKGRKYGRWEGRVRAPAADPSYNALLLLWPDEENWPEGGEIDFMEMGDPARQKTDGFVHYGADNRQVHGSVETDAAQWHNWAVEWTPSEITMFLDGREWFRTTDSAVQPPGAMHLCVQLDWFPKGGSVRESTMQVDWVREYAMDNASEGAADAPPTTTRERAGNDGSSSGWSGTGAADTDDLDTGG